MRRRDFLAFAAAVTALGAAGVGAEALAESEAAGPYERLIARLKEAGMWEQWDVFYLLAVPAKCVPVNLCA